MNRDKSSHVSVILPYHNRQDTLGEAARSVLDQTHGELTLYLIDDGSTDDSALVAKAFDDPRVEHILVPVNSGASHARNIGLNKASTSLVAFMDSDDVWLPSKLATQIRLLRTLQGAESGVSIVGCGWRTHGSHGSGIDFHSGPFSRTDVLYNRVPGVGTPKILIDRDTANSGVRFDESLPSLEERDYILSCLANGTKIAVAPEVLILVRRGRGDHLANPKSTAQAWEALMSKYSAELEDHPDLRAWYSFEAARQHLRSWRIGRTLPHVRLALSDQPARRVVHLLFGAIGGRRGLAVAQRVTPV